MKIKLLTIGKTDDAELAHLIQKYESRLKHYIQFSLEIIPDLKKYFSGRKIVFCREISKIYEEFIRKNVDDLEIFNKELKGELTIVISEKKIKKNHSQELSESDMNIIKKMINKLSIKEITEIISQNKDISKKEIYNYCLKIKNEI